MDGTRQGMRAINGGGTGSCGFIKSRDLQGKGALSPDAGQGR